MTKAHPTEKDVKAKAKALLDKHGWFFWMPPASQFGKSGVSDLHAVKPGVFMCVEFKLEPNKPTALQKAFLTMIHQASHLAFVVTDKNMDSFELWLKAFDEAQAVMQKGGDEKDIPNHVGSMLVNTSIDLVRGFCAVETLSAMAAHMPSR